MPKVTDDKKVSASFRDPSGFLFYRGNILYRQVNMLYRPHYDCFMDSGCYKKMIGEGLLVPHVEVNLPPEDPSTAYKTIQPEIIPFISYPYEWCFSQLKAAASITLRVQKLAIQYGMSLKDASAYNIQFKGGNPILIDTLSFEKYQEGKPWIAYRQFCQHFLAPLALMALTDVRLNQLSRIYIDGIPLDLASALLPKKTWFRFGILTHIHLHSRSQKYFGDKKVTTARRLGVSQTSLSGIVDSLETMVRKIDWKLEETEWGTYYEDTNYSHEALSHKKEIVRQYMAGVKAQSVWDLGANTGLFSRLASERGVETISFDVDPTAVEKNYLEVTKNKEGSILPLCLDLTNPSPGVGWDNNERVSLRDRGPVDVIMALALVHHLAISNNLPFKRIARFFSTLCRYLIIEFVPKSDSQVQRLFVSREDIFSQYTPECFVSGFSEYFLTEKVDPIEGSARILYLMKNRRDT